MEKIIGRDKELQHLEELYSKNESIACAIYGRRRIGKTFLLKEFCKNKRSLMIYSTELLKESNLEIIHSSMSIYIDSIQKFTSLLDIIEPLRRICSSEEKTVVVFDEFPYLVNTCKDAPSIIQNFIDMHLTDLNVMLILCGSSISTMKKELEGYDKPLYGRFDSKFELKPISLKNCKEFHANMNDLDIIKVYLTVGGIPLYHKRMNESSYERNVLKNFSGDFGSLSEEANSIIQREFTPYESHSKIISIVAHGSTRLKEIAEKTGLSPAICSKYLGNLEYIGLVETIKPMGNSPKHPIYKIKDNLIRFHQNVIQQNLALFNKSERQVFTTVEPRINSLLGLVFEDLCTEFIEEKYICKEIGKWWGRVGDADSDIDIVATVVENDNEVTYYCECKFTKEKVGFEVYNKLVNRSKYVKGFSNCKFMIFSTGGFESTLIEHSQYGDLVLVDMDELLN